MICGRAGRGIPCDGLYLFVRWFFSRWRILTVHVDSEGVGVRLGEVGVRGQTGDFPPVILPFKAREVQEDADGVLDVSAGGCADRLSDGGL